MKSTHTFDFSLNDSVLIIAINEPGRIDGLKVSLNGIEYLVAYWYSGERKAEWLQAQELK